VTDLWFEVRDEPTPGSGTCSARHASSSDVRVLTFRDVNVEELVHDETDVADFLDE
jgi:hypothetical protein